MALRAATPGPADARLQAEGRPVPRPRARSFRVLGRPQRPGRSAACIVSMPPFVTKGAAKVHVPAGHGV
eukprot:7282032-Lingulodinium_polyedra.AAC.1